MFAVACYIVVHQVVWSFAEHVLKSETPGHMMTLHT